MEILYGILNFLKVLLIFIIAYELLARLVRRFAKFPAPPFIGKFLDSDFRRKLQPPSRIIRDSGIRAGITVLEAGCGSGAFTVDAARVIGSEGKLYALDIAADMLAQLRRKLANPANRDIQNIDMLNNSAYDIKLGDGTADVVFMVTVFQEIPDKQRALSEFRRVLKPDGILAISEWFVDPDYPWMSTTIKQCARGGFRLHRRSGNMWSYTLQFVKG
jgi:ubiquinone/menaquinone biosynthesis C-methylase UbiE